LSWVLQEWKHVCMGTDLAGHALPLREELIMLCIIRDPVDAL
jgi:hypothetical protein